MIFESLNRGECKTYLVACPETREALLVDPLLTRVEQDLAVLERLGLRLGTVLDTHVHADHLSACTVLKERTGARIAMFSGTPAKNVDVKLEDGSELAVGRLRARILHTPGHTTDSITVVFPDRIVTGDFLFLGEGGAGRTDLLGGDAGQHWDSLQKLRGLADSVRVYPGHDYHGRESSTLGEERAHNERLRPRTREEYVKWLSGFDFGAAPWMVDVVKANISGARDPKCVTIPADTATCEVKTGACATGGVAADPAVRTISARDVASRLEQQVPAFVLDVRNPDEFNGELGHVAGATLIPVHELSGRLGELRGREEETIYTICKMGGRAAKAAKILTSAGFSNVWSVEGGMVAWNREQLPVTR